MARSPRTTFFVKNLSRGILWLVILLAGFILFNHYVDVESSAFLMSLGDNPELVYTIYFFSEIIVGIIPPEMFMIWSLEFTQGRNYVLDVALLAAISYVAGVITYLFGIYFNKTVLYRYLRKKYLGKFETRFHQFGGFLLFVAAVTPVPYSGICMVMGAVNYSRKKFFLITLFRFARFIVYGYIIWHASLI